MGFQWMVGALVGAAGSHTCPHTWDIMNQHSRVQHRGWMDDVWIGKTVSDVSLSHQS
jgi:hypothetical protein